jgi:Ca2+-binding RTX toxin-like protein
MKFKVGRATGNTNEFTMIGESAQVTPTANILNSYFTRIPVKAGDLIGNFNATTTNCTRPGGAVYTDFFINGDVVPPTTAVYPFSAAAQLDLSALLESDCDNDGFGDETQDTNLSSCAPGTIPPPAPTPGGTPVTCKGLAATIVGTAGNDARTGSLGKDVIAGLGGNDTLSGVGGNDVICGGGGKDLLKGGKGNDKLYGQAGADTLKGGKGNDTCKGGKGKDTLSSC